MLSFLLPSHASLGLTGELPSRLSCVCIVTCHAPAITLAIACVTSSKSASDAAIRLYSTVLSYVYAVPLRAVYLPRLHQLLSPAMSAHAVDAECPVSMAVCVNTQSQQQCTVTRNDKQ